jgi:hypothetical protein
MLAGMRRATRHLAQAGVTRVSVFAAIVVGALAGANCGGDSNGDDGPDDGPDDRATCAELGQEWDALIATVPIDGCDSVLDCRAYQRGSSAYTCEPHPVISGTFDSIVTRVPSPEVLGRLNALEAEFAARCNDCDLEGVSCYYDTPPVEAACVDQRCVGEYGECNPPDPTCEELIGEFSAIAAALDRTCETVDDCLALGRDQESPGCDCSPVLTNPCEGIPIAAAALTQEVNDQLAWILQEFELVGCFEEGGPCDCAVQEMFCSDEGLCSLGTGNTCAPPPDASLADAVP